MNLRKVIKEEIDSFDWVEETNPISVGTVFRPIYEKSPEQAFYYVIESIDDDMITFRYPVYPNGEFGGGRVPDGQASSGKMPVFGFLDKIRNGKISIINNITESNDFEWIDDANPAKRTWEELVVGDTIIYEPKHFSEPKYYTYHGIQDDRLRFREYDHKRGILMNRISYNNLVRDGYIK